MKIANVSCTPVRLPLEAALYRSDRAGTKREWGRLSRFSPKRPTPMLEYVIVEIETQGGHRGTGEAQADIGFFGNTVEGVAAAIEDYLGPQIVGGDVLDRGRLMHLIDYRGNSCAKAGIDMALYDLAGRASGRPVCEILGGRHRERVRVAIEIAGDTPEKMAAECAGLVGRGVRAFKPKIGGVPEEDVERLAAIREAVGPDVSLRADANQGYSIDEATRLCRLAADARVGLELLEQPLPAWDLDGMARLRRSVDTPIEADESAFSIHDVEEIIRHEAADVINIKIGKAGGLARAREIAALAEEAGLKCVLGTAFGLGTEIAAKLHLAASIPGMTDAVEFTEIAKHGSLLAPPHREALGLPLEDGCLPVPGGAGLGVELDAAKVRAHRLVS